MCSGFNIMLLIHYSLGSTTNWLTVKAWLRLARSTYGAEAESISLALRCETFGKYLGDLV